MKKIIKLSDATINKIAAGEVVERPASVIKELVENSIDAGAKNIIVKVERAGKNLITVIDDGVGMTKEDLSLAIQRHTTSKLNEEDIMNITSFGFRGEALPSIASVSRIKITSKEQSQEEAYSLIKEDDNRIKIEPANLPRGTIIEIRDLFFSTPARIKFLKSDNTELAAAVDVVKRLAISYPKISFSFFSNDKILFKYDAVQDSVIRINDILGKDFSENSTEVNLIRDDIHIYGYTSLPTYNKSTGADQYLFVNNRPVKDKLLNVALKVAYQDFLASNRFPMSVIFLNIAFDMVDVNAHPAKTEVRFNDSNLVRNIMIHAIKESIRSGEHRSAAKINDLTIFKMENKSNFSLDNNLELENTDIKYKNQADIFHENNNSANRSYDFNLLKNYTETDNAISDIQKNIKQKKELVKTEEIKLNTYEMIESHPLGYAKAQLYNTYIISQTEKDVIIIDQHAAHERLIYEELKKSLESQGILRQRLLIPEIVELSCEFKTEILYNHRNELLNLGMKIDKFAQDSIMVSELPAILGSQVNIQQLVLDLANNFEELGENIILSELIEKVTETFACHNSIRAGKTMSIPEMNELLRQMERTAFSGQCNHGRPTYVTITAKDIAKLFCRT